MKTPGIFAVAALCCVCRLSADTLPPVVPSASVSPSTVDVTSGPQTVTITMQATDDDSGVDFGNSYLFDGANHMVSLRYFNSEQRTSGNALDGTYTFTMIVPQYARPGVWRVESFINDFAGNQVSFNPSATAYPDPEAMKFTVVNSGPVDEENAALVSASISPGEVNVTEEDAIVTITTNLTDNLSGFDFGFLTLRGPEGNGEVSKYFSPEDLTSGTATNGFYQFTATVPQGSPAGIWNYRFSLKDKAGNSFETEDIGTITVISAPPPPKTSVFLADATDASQLPWSSSGSGWILQTTETSDADDAAATLPVPDGGSASITTKVTGPGELSFQWRVDSEADHDFLSVSVDGGPTLRSLSGDMPWESFMLVLGPGEHTVEWIYAKDGSGASGGDRAYLDQVRFRRDVDSELPLLQSLDITPRFVDATGGAQEVEFRIAVTDDHHGVSEGRLALFDPSGAERMSTLFDSGSLTGDPTDGYWVISMEIPADADFGLWRARVELTEETTGQTRAYGAGGEAFPAKESNSFYVGQPGAADVVAPLVQAVSVTPGAVDITTGAVTAMVTLQVTDPIRGFWYGSVAVYNPDDNWTGAVDFDIADRIKGDEFNGVYQIQVSVPALGKAGKWTVGARVTDNGGNTREYPFDPAFPQGLDPSFQVTNSGTVDLAAPVVTSLEITPASVNTGAASAAVQVTASIQDPLSGVLQAFAYFYTPADEFRNDLFTDIGVHRISGNASSGVYQFSVTLPQGSPPGQWRLRIFLRDKAGNAAFLGDNVGDYPDLNDGFFAVAGTPVSVFDAYLAGYPLTGNDALPSADPDRDGLNNATEVLLGTNPATATTGSGGLISSGRDATNFYLNFTIASGLTATANGDFLELRNGSGGPPLRVTGQTQAGLSGPWTNVLPASVGGANYRVSIPLASGAKGFLRLHLEDP